MHSEFAVPLSPLRSVEWAFRKLTRMVPMRCRRLAETRESGNDSYSKAESAMPTKARTPMHMYMKPMNFIVGTSAKVKPSASAPCRPRVAWPHYLLSAAVLVPGFLISYWFVLERRNVARTSARLAFYEEALSGQHLCVRHRLAPAVFLRAFYAVLLCSVARRYEVRRSKIASR